MNKYFYFSGLLTLVLQFIYLLNNNFSTTDYFLISGLTILYGALMAGSIEFANQELDA